MALVKFVEFANLPSLPENFFRRSYQNSQELSICSWCKSFERKLGKTSSVSEDLKNAWRMQVDDLIFKPWIAKAQRFPRPLKLALFRNQKKAVLLNTKVQRNAHLPDQIRSRRTNIACFKNKMNNANFLLFRTTCSPSAWQNGLFLGPRT